MTEKEPSTQDTILLATINCINAHGIEHLTTRMIAEEAGANIASINYYFRTKEILVNQALEVTIKHMLEDVTETIQNPNLEFNQVLHDVIYYMISGAAANMGITKAHLYRLVIEEDYESISATSFKAVFDDLLDRAVQTYPHHETKHLHLTLASIFSAIMFMMQSPFFLELKEESQMKEESFHRDLTNHFTEMFYRMM